MADTQASVGVSTAWASVSSLTDSNILAGTACVIQNQGSVPVYAVIAATQPATDMRGWLIPADLRYPLSVPAGESEVWLRVQSVHRGSVVNIQEA